MTMRPVVLAWGAAEIPTAAARAVRLQSSKNRAVLR